MLIKDPAVIELKGTYSDMGRTMGRTLKRNNFAPGASSNITRERAEMADKNEKLINKYMPGILDMLMGMSEAGFEYNHLRMIPLVLSFGLQPQPCSAGACTIMYLPPEYTESGTPVYIRNYDWDYSSISNYSKLHSRLNGGIGNISFTDLWFGAYGGVNEEGLSIAITAGASYSGKVTEGLPMTLIIQWSLDHFKTVKEVVDYMREIPHFLAINYIVSDRNGNAARIETSSEKVHIVQGSDILLIQTNHYESAEMKFLQDPEKVFPSSVNRYNNALKWAEKNKSKINLIDIEQFMKTPVARGGIFDHEFWEGRECGTIWSWFFDYKAMTLHYSTGKPDIAPFAEIIF